MIKSSWITKAYAGDAKLWKVFWYGYVGSLIPVAILSNIAKEMIIKNYSLILPFTLLLICFALYYWLAVSLWRSSKNSSHKGFMILGRIWSFVLALMLISGIQLIIQILKAQ